MPQPSSCRLWWDDSVGAYRLVTPYRPQFVDLLKQLAPGPDRVWDGPTKTWLVAERILTPVKNLVEQIFGGTVIVITKADWAQQQPGAGASQQGNFNRPSNQAGNGLATLIYEWFKLLPYPAARKAYLLASMELHPDKGGSPEAMSRFNSLWQQIEKLHYQK